MSEQGSLTKPSKGVLSQQGPLGRASTAADGHVAEEAPSSPRASVCSFVKGVSALPQRGWWRVSVKPTPVVALTLSEETDLGLATVASPWARGSLKGPEFSSHILGVTRGEGSAPLGPRVLGPQHASLVGVGVMACWAAGQA